MARPKSKDKNQKRYYAYKEYIILDGIEIVYFVGLTNSISQQHPNGYSRLHNNIPAWKEVTTNLMESLGGFKDMSEFHKVHHIKRSYGKYFVNYWDAKNKFHNMIIENDSAACYNFVECVEPKREELGKYTGELEVSKVSSTNAINSNSPQILNVEYLHY